jgi:ABC-type transporter Mla subunit MlaD
MSEVEDRAQRIFGKLQNIQTTVEGEKQQKFKLLVSYLQNVEQTIEEAQHQKNQKFLDVAEKVSHPFIKATKTEICTRWRKGPKRPIG